MQNFYQLDQLIQGYFNQDFDIINDGEDTIEGILKLFQRSASEQTLKELAKEVDDFISVNKNRLDEEFESRYSFDFSPELWETTAHEFLLSVKEVALGRNPATYK